MSHQEIDQLGDVECPVTHLYSIQTEGIRGGEKRKKMGRGGGKGKGEKPRTDRGRTEKIILV